MSRPNRTASSIRGPQSALTDFLAAHNISANQIRRDADARRQVAQISEDSDPADEPEPEPEPDSSTLAPPSRSTRSRGARKQDDKDKKATEKEKKALEKIKAGKDYQRRKRFGSRDDDDLARSIYQGRAASLPGQMDNCEICNKRFTVTAYSRAGPEGGLLCNPCGKELEKAKEPPTKKKRVAGPVGRRRQVQSSILDGTYQLGAKSLTTLCIETLVKNIDLADELGDLPPVIVDKIARKLSKRRLLDSRTLDLFLTPTNEDVFVYDAAKLTSDDLIHIFRTVPALKNIKIKNGIQFKDEVMDYLLSRDIELTGFYLHGANLLSDEKWNEFLRRKGRHLRSLRIYFTDRHVTNAVMAQIATSCSSLQCLKVAHNQEVDGDGVKELANVKSLRRLALELRKDIHSDVYVHLLQKVGPQLEKFCVSHGLDVDNTVLDALHQHCRSLHKLRITESDSVTDEGFVRLFTDWANPGLTHIDVEKCRHLDSRATKNPNQVGLCSDGFRALMAHSGKDLVRLNVHACRHISAAAFEEVFGPDRTYPDLVKMEISFCEEVTDFIVGSIFRSCPKLRMLNVFGCMKVKEVVVPRGRLLVGVPTAMGMVIDGNDDRH